MGIVAKRLKYPNVIFAHRFGFSAQNNVEMALNIKKRFRTLKFEAPCLSVNQFIKIYVFELKVLIHTTA